MNFDVIPHYIFDDKFVRTRNQEVGKSFEVSNRKIQIYPQQTVIIN